MLEMCNPIDRFLSVVSLLTARIPRIHSWEYVKPSSVAEVMTRLSLNEEGECKKLIKERGCLSISEPCVGSGSALIAAHKVTLEFGINPNFVELTGTDNFNETFRDKVG